MRLVKVNPWTAAPSFQAIFDGFFNDPFVNSTDDTENKKAACAWNPVVDIYEKDDAIVLKADLPGITKDNIIIDVDGRVLTIKGERSYDEETKEKNFYRRERRFGSFQRAFTLPEQVDPDAINAEFKNGELKIVITKPEEKKAKQITVN